MNKYKINTRITYQFWFLTRPILLVVLISITYLGHSQITSSFEFSLKDFPFSRYGSYLALSQKTINGSEALYLREVSGKYAWTDDRIFQIELIENGKVAPFENINATPALLRAKTKQSELEICFESEEILRMRAKSASIRITKIMEDPRQWEWIIPVSESQVRIHGGFDKYALTAMEGNLVTLAGERKVEVSGEFAEEDAKGKKIWSQFQINPSAKDQIEIALERYVFGWGRKSYTKPFDESQKETQTSFDLYVNKSIRPVAKYQASTIEACYINWSSVVNPRGNLKRPTMLMSKNLMRHVWSWDHCFNAIALAEGGNHDLAWDQFMVFFDIQDEETGALVDYANDHHVQIDFVKPPIHGMTINQLMKVPGMMTKARVEEVYPHLAKWTNFWFKYRDDDGDGLPQYNHGNDSGWDNGTIFDIGYPVEGADLSAYLVIQMDVLALLAEKLSKSEEAIAWKKRADKLLELMLSELWRKDHFVSTRSGDGLVNEQSQSLMSYLPMILGERLPSEIRKTLVEQFAASGLVTQYGPATEHVDSPFYGEDDYWRGAIWPSSAYIIINGVKACGNEQLAQSMANQYIETLDKNGFRENHSAKTGAGYRDLGYTWTSSVFLALQYEYPLK